MIISKKQAIIPAGMFHGLVFLVKRSGEKQNRLTLVEAKNSVLQLWAPMGQTEPVVQPAIFLGSIDPKVAGFVFGTERAEEGGDETRLARKESQRQGAGRLFVA